MTLISEIEAYLARTGTLPTTFGRACCQNPSFIRELQEGRICRKRTIDKTLGFMAANPQGVQRTKPDLTLITHEARQLAAQVNDLPGIARHINAAHGTNYQANDIEKLLLGLKPTDSIMRAPKQVRESKLMEQPITWTPPISTNRKGVDPLAKALLQWGADNRGLPGMTRAMCEERL